MTKNQKTNPQHRTLLVLLVDRSGSMQTIREDMEGGIKALLEEQAAEPGVCLVTLAQFDTEYEVLYRAVPVAELDGYQLTPRGSTALLDAIGRTLGEVKDHLDARPADERPDQVVFAVVTDGLENSSREWSRDQVMAAVKTQVEAGWHFTFLGANQDAIQEGGALGVAAGASLTWNAAPQASRAAMHSLSSAVGRLRRGEAASVTYTDDERRTAKDE
jgi:Mg-chelatase subunit ChlD